MAKSFCLQYVMSSRAKLRIKFYFETYQPDQTKRWEVHSSIIKQTHTSTFLTKSNSKAFVTSQNRFWKSYLAKMSRDS